MNFYSDLSLSDEYQSFRSSVPLKKISVESDGSKVWQVYDAGPRNVRTPLVCLSPASGTADVFYQQILGLTSRGIRVMAVEAPVFWNVDDWCEGFRKLLDHLDIDKIHIFGASLGGFLGQKFAEYTCQYPRVVSLILCNTFVDTMIFNHSQTAAVFWMMPAIVLKKFISGNMEYGETDVRIAKAMDFMTERLETLQQSELASRLTLNCVSSFVDTSKIRNVKVTIIDVFDKSALTTSARDEVAKRYPQAKLAHLKTGGNFPYLSRPDEVNLHITLHLRQFNGSRFAAFDTSPDEVPETTLSRPISVATTVVT